MKYYFIHLPMKMEPIVSSETSAIKSQTPGNYPKRNKFHLHRQVNEVLLHSPAYEDGTDSEFRNVGS